MGLTLCTSRLLRMLVGVLAVGLLGCRGGRSGEGEIRGSVVDLFGRPVPATVSVEGLALSVHPDRTGRYRLPYVPGRFRVLFEAPGFAKREMEWHLYDAAEVAAAPVTMVSFPAQPGLWLATSERYVRIQPTPLQVTTERVLGLQSGARRSVRLEGLPHRWCLDRPLVWWEDSRLELTVSAWIVGPGGHLWTEGEERRGRPRTLRMEQRADSLWLITTHAPGPVAIVVEAKRTYAARPAAHYLDAVDCGGETR